MDIITLIEKFDNENYISEEIISLILNDGIFRKELVNYFKINKNRKFAIKLLDELIALRNDSDQEITSEDLMFSCYILGLHNQIEDCIKIWDVKTIDFDTHCGIDIQLLIFAGIEETIDFLKKQNNSEVNKALEYVIECNNCGDFDGSKDYYNSNILPWFI